LNVLLRGQSNAYYLGTEHGRNITTIVEYLLGFDGVADRVGLEFAVNTPAANTAVGGTALLGDWLGGGPGAWQPLDLELGLLRYIGGLPPQQRAQPTAVVWLHNEYDSGNPALTAQTWVDAVRYDAALVRQAYGQGAAQLPYLFVSAIPYPWGTPAGAQAIRVGMEALAADPAFHARIAARAPDLDMSRDDWDGNPNTAEYGGGHMSAADGALLAHRVALSLAQEWAAYAKPGSPMARLGGAVDDLGPQVVQAGAVGPNLLELRVRHDVATALKPLDAVAAGGEGWSVWVGGQHVDGIAAALTGPDSLLVVFDGPLPAGGRLYYAAGYGRLAGPDGSGHGHAVYDNGDLPIWVQAIGLPIGGTAADLVFA
jgi:hypothetical protein